MNHLTPDMPSMPAGASRTSSATSTLLTVGFLLVLALLFSASSLIDASVSTTEARYDRPAMAAPADMDTGGPSAGSAESYEVADSVRQWSWEGRNTERKPIAGYDFEELWLTQY
jgi:hypothetical protein